MNNEIVKKIEKNEIPEYIHFFLNQNKPNLDEIYNNETKDKKGILNINIDKLNNKVDVFFVSIDNIKKKDNFDGNNIKQDYYDYIEDHKIFQILDVNEQKIYMI
tara:strand:- start:2736 stop:3047 length:312 start_codon:yes stop_codon:yes gene_type:complete